MLRLQECQGELSWCVVQTVPGKEPLAASEIVRAGLSAFWPRFRASVTTNGYSSRTRPVMRSLFPSYVFVGFRPGTDEWRWACGVPGQQRVLTSAPERPSLIPMAILRALLGHENELAHNLRMARIAFAFKVGDRVRIVDGPFTGFYAELTRLDDDGRISLLLDFLGAATPVTGMTAEQIEVA